MDNCFSCAGGDTEQFIKDQIQKYGWAVIGSVTTNGTPFAYTIGFKKTINHPELFCIGLPQEVCQHFFNIIGMRIKDNDMTIKLGEKRTDLVQNDYPCVFIQANEQMKDDYMAQAVGYYGDMPFEVYQMVWCNKYSKFPWDEEFTQYQPLFNDPNQPLPHLGQLN